MVDTCCEELRIAAQDHNSYSQYHRVLKCKTDYGVARIVALWSDLSRSVKKAFLDSLSRNEVMGISDFLRTRLVQDMPKGDRDFLVQELVRFQGVSTLIPLVIEVYSDLPRNLQREVEWFLMTSQTSAGLRFLGDLMNSAGDSPAQPIRKLLRQDTLATAHGQDIAAIAKALQTYYSGPDEWSVKAWLSQFEQDSDRLLMLKLLKRVIFFGQSEIAAAIEHMWSRLPPQERIRASVTGLGPPHKSGVHLLYEFRPSFDFRREKAVQDLGSILESSMPDPLVIVFVDDMIGTGHQAVRLWHHLLGQRPGSVRLSSAALERLKTSRRYYLAVAGFSEGVSCVKSSGAFHDVLVGVELDDTSRAFSERAGVFESLAELRAGERVATFYGNYLYPRQPLETDNQGAGPLGYEDSQALVAFYYNTPNNSLPVLWGTGTIRGRDWIPLLPRRG